MVVVLGVAIFSGAAGSSSGVGLFGEGGDLAVGRVPAAVAQQQGVFADRRQVHVFVGQLAAHHPGVRADCEDVEAATMEDVEILLVMGAVLLFEALPVGVEAVGVLHGEFAHSDEARAGAGIVAPLGLDMID